MRQFGSTAEFIGGTALKGSPQQVVDRIGEYRDAGAEMVILALRRSDVDGLDRFAAEVLPASARWFAGSLPLPGYAARPCRRGRASKPQKRGARRGSDSSTPVATKTIATLRGRIARIEDRSASSPTASCASAR